MKLIKGLMPYIDKAAVLKELEGSQRLGELFDLIENTEHLTDSEIMKSLGIRARESYKQLKLRLQTKLIEHLSKNGLKYKQVDKFTMVYQKCSARVTLTKILLMNNERELSVKLSEIAIRSTMRYGFTELSLILCRDLYHYYSIIKYDQRKMNRYKDLMQGFRKLYIMELNAYEYLFDLRSLFLKSRGPLKDKELSRAIEYFEAVNGYLKSDNISYQLMLQCYNVMAMRFEIECDFKKLIQISDEAIEKLSLLPLTRKAGILVFDTYKVEAYIQLGMFREAEEIARRNFRIVTIGSLNWAVLKTYMLISGLHSKKYHNSYETICEIRSRTTPTKNPMHLKEVWSLLEAHIEYLIAIGKIQPSEPSTFRLNKFLNEIPHYSKDKRGLNISILIIQFLFLLQQRKYSKIIDRAEALKLYCYRYLRRDDTFRSHCFIRMLLQMPRADFNRIRTERYAEAFLKKLQSVPLKISQQTIEVEVIPYEDLWEMSLELLD